MASEICERVERVIHYEAALKAPPPEFPAFPEIPGGRYIREDFHALEIEHVWHKSWVCAGTEEGLREAGQYRVFDNLGVPLILVRGKDARLRAFYNTCRHRGAPVVREREGRTTLLLFWPRGVHSCEMEALYIAPDWGDGERPPFWDTFIPIFDGVLDEDMMNLAPIQTSLRSGAFTGMMINYQERRIYWFYEEIDRRIGAKSIPDGLAVKQLLSNFVEGSVAAARE